MKKGTGVLRTREQRRRRGCTCETKGRVGEEVPVYRHQCAR